MHLYNMLHLAHTHKASDKPICCNSPCTHCMHASYSCKANMWPTHCDNMQDAILSALTQSMTDSAKWTHHCECMLQRIDAESSRYSAHSGSVDRIGRHMTQLMHHEHEVGCNGEKSLLGGAGKGHSPSQANGCKDVNRDEHHLAKDDAVPAHQSARCYAHLCTFHAENFDAWASCTFAFITNASSIQGILKTAVACNISSKKY